MGEKTETTEAMAPPCAVQFPTPQRRNLFLRIVTVLAWVMGGRASANG